MKRFDVVEKRPSELTTAEIQAWREFVAVNPALGSPYFAFEFAECCEEARDDTRVLIARRAGQIIGFLPFHTGKFGFTRPLGGPLSDVHGLIMEPGQEMTPQEILSAGNIPMFAFNAGLLSQKGFGDASDLQMGSWMLDLSQGHDSWHAQRKAVAKKAMRNVATRQRRLQEVDGGFSYVMADYRPIAFETMVKWKQRQYSSSGVFDVFSVDWTQNLLKAILKREADTFSGLCSTLSIDGEIIAVHVGMASERVCHYWFPAYDEDKSTLSPGILLLMEMARTSAAIGHDALELGPGRFAFKKDLGTYQVGLANGYIGNNSMQLAGRSVANALTKSFDAAPFGRASQWPAKAFRKLDRLAGFYAA